MTKCKPIQNAEPCEAVPQDPYHIEIEADWVAMNYGSIKLSHKDELFAAFYFGPTTPIKDYTAALEIVEFIKSKFQP